jgi:hypothetical protein
VTGKPVFFFFLKKKKIKKKKKKTCRRNGKQVCKSAHRCSVHTGCETDRLSTAPNRETSQNLGCSIKLAVSLLEEDHLTGSNSNEGHCVAIQSANSKRWNGKRDRETRRSRPCNVVASTHNRGGRIGSERIDTLAGQSDPVLRVSKNRFVLSFFSLTQKTEQLMHC